MRERIIEHTTKMFARDGVKAIRMDDIAAELGISKRTIYEIFGDKESLIFECIDFFMRRMHRENEELTKGAGNVISEFLLMLDVWEERMDNTCNIVDDVRKFHPRLYERYMNEHMREGSEMLRGKLRQGVAQGYLLPNLDIEMVLVMMGHSVYGAIKADVSQREIFKFFMTHFIRGMSTQKGIKLIDEKLNNL